MVYSVVILYRELFVKLYSKRHLVLTALVTTFVLGSVFFGFYYGKSYFAENTHNVANSENKSSVQEENLFQLQTAQPAAIQISRDSDYTVEEAQNIYVYELCNEAVVNINTQTMGLNWFLEPVSLEGGSGSGSIIDTRGYVITNVHVIQDAHKIYISLHDGTQYEGRVIGTDAASDIAVLKFDPPAGVELKTISFGDSSATKVGQKVIAIGNPFGLERTMTTGIVSGLGRPIQSSKNTIIRDMIQTDTAINPGNSGGPLLDTKGRMLGINTMIYSTSGSSAGVGFAVPINTAKRVVSDLIQYGTVKRGVIQAKFVQLNASIARYAKMPIASGLLISELTKGGNAEKAGLAMGTEPVRYGSSRNPQIIYLGGDVLTAINDIKIATFADYYSVLESKKPGDTVKLTVLRGKHTIDLYITLVSEN
ncbi:MAG: trypsin-like serine protease [Spirochaetaceae bacterium]|nr:trypsin-like serine protease [Spirochaetaceae bacterium]